MECVQFTIITARPGFMVRTEVGRWTEVMDRVDFSVVAPTCIVPRHGRPMKDFKDRVGRTSPYFSQLCVILNSSVISIHHIEFYIILN